MSGKTKVGYVDPRLIYPEIPKSKDVQKQMMHGSEFVKLSPTSQTPTSYTFDIKSNGVVLFGPHTGFQIRGNFMKKTAAGEDYELVTEAEYSRVIVQPNWWSYLVKSVDVFHKNYLLNADDQPQYCQPFLDTYMYAHMTDKTKKYLCTESCAPGNGIPKSSTGWSVTADSEWHKYSKEIFSDEGVYFRYIPLQFPFFQHADFAKGRAPNAFPMSLMQSLTFRLNLVDDTSIIFKKNAGNTDVYKFELSTIAFMYEEARLSPGLENAYFTNKRTGVLPYAGITKIGTTDSAGDTFSCRAKFENVMYPTGIFIAALPKTVVAGQFKYADSATPSLVFVKPNIKQVDVQFEGQNLFLKDPNPGMIAANEIDIKTVVDHLENPPFGIEHHPDLLTLKYLQEGSAITPFPHVYISLCQSGNQGPIVPHNSDGKNLNRPGQLDVKMTLNTGGNKDVTFFAWLFYHDIVFQFDIKNRQFVPYYGSKRSTI
jgi:hypothetical protein